MRAKVVITNWVHPETTATLAPHCTVDANPERRPWSREEVLDHARDAVALMTFMPDAGDGAFLDRCPRLRIIACALKGYDNFDVDACTERGVWLTIVPDLLTAPSAELAVGLLIGLLRNIAEGDRFVRSGRFSGWRPLLYGSGLAGSTVGIFAAGAVGSAIVERLQGFGCRAILYHDLRRLPENEERRLGLTFVSFEDLVGESDFLVLAAPLSAETRHRIGAAALGAMKPGGYLVNISRGSIVDEEAVADALQAGRLAGYAADVFEMEDWLLADRPRRITPRLLAMAEKTLFTPHLGSAVERVRREIEMFAARSIVQYLKGDPPDGAVNRPL